MVSTPKQRTVPTALFLRKVALGALAGLLLAALLGGPLAQDEYAASRDREASQAYRNALCQRLLSATPAQRADASQAMRKKRQQAAQAMVNEEAFNRAQHKVSAYTPTDEEYGALINALLKGDPVMLPTLQPPSWRASVLLPTQLAFWLVCLLLVQLGALANYLVWLLFYAERKPQKYFLSQLDWHRPSVKAVVVAMGPLTWLAMAVSWRRYQEYLPAATRRDRYARGH